MEQGARIVAPVREREQQVRPRLRHARIVLERPAIGGDRRVHRAQLEPQVREARPGRRRSRRGLERALELRRRGRELAARR